jgi:hypothetical protein
MLCPVPTDESADLAHAISAMQVFMRTRPPSDQQIMTLIEWGR